MSSPASRRISSPLRYHSPRNKLKRHSILSTSELAEEFTKVFISSTAAFQKSLDDHLDEQERLHKEALGKSLAEHEAVRQSAEQARLRVEAELERDRRRREDEEIARLEEIKRQTEQEQRKREEAAQRKREEQAKLERERVEKAEQARLEKERKKQADDEAAKNEADERRRAAEKKAAEAADRAAAAAAAEKAALAEAQQQQEQKKRHEEKGLPSTTSLENITVLSCTGENRRTQERLKYLTLHKKLKEMRAWTLNEAANANLKTQLGDMRRTIQKSLSIINAIDKQKNTKPTLDIRTVLEQAAQIPIMLSLKELGLGDGQYPAALLFLLNYFAKYTIHRYTDQCSRDPKAADAYGVLVAQIFANSAFHFNGNSLIDILWAKYYKVCPILFGLPGGTTLEDHVGLAAGFASITLRNFSKSKNRNPAPNHLYWTSLARVLSTPPEKRTAAHYVVLRNMIIHSIDRFIHFYGSAALAAMRVAFKQWPEGVKQDANTMALEATPAVLEKEYGLVL